MRHLRLGSWTIAFVGLATSAGAQTEDQLRRFFEGKRVTVKIEMPGTEDGVDVYPGTSQPVDFPKHARRLKEFGTAVRSGESVMVTKVRVKRDLVEFQLGGGGYGTMWDDASPHVPVAPAVKTQREKNLERDLAATTDPAAKRKIKEELDGLRRDRERIDASNRATAAQAQQLKASNIRQRRLEGGSRFNLRYRTVLPEEALTPDGVMRALAEYVDFSPLLATRATGPGLHGERPTTPGELRKGLLVEEVDALLGRPETINQRTEGTLRVSTSVYLPPGKRIEAEFVEGVLVRYTVTSR